MSNKYYLQESTGYTGNSMVWWKKDHKGYTTNLKEAHVFTKAQAVRQNKVRGTDIPWPKPYIDKLTVPTVDMQHCWIENALENTGIVLNSDRD